METTRTSLIALEEEIIEEAKRISKSMEDLQKLDAISQENFK